MTVNPPNPFAPGSTVDHESDDGGEGNPAAPGRPARWLALLGSFLCWYPLMGVGHFVMGRPRRWLAWMAVGIVAFALMVVAVRMGAAKVFLVVVAGMTLALVGSVIDVARIQAGTTAPPFRRALTVVILLFIAERGIGAATKQWIVEAFSIPSGAMIPNLLVGDHIMVKVGREANRGAAIVFKYPRDPSIDYIKRVIAVGGDVVEIQGGVVVVNGSPLPQTALAGDVACGTGTERCAAFREENGAHSYTVTMMAERLPQSFGPFIVPAGHVFVMGDNRDNSSDSRVWGPVPNVNVKGTVSLIYWSQGDAIRWDRIGTVPP